MIPKNTRVKVKPGYELHVHFKGLGNRLFDMKPFLTKGSFKELQDDKYFKKVRIVWGGIEWPHEQDLSVETLYSLSTPLRETRQRVQRTRPHGGVHGYSNG